MCYHNGDADKNWALDHDLPQFLEDHDDWQLLVTKIGISTMFEIFDNHHYGENNTHNKLTIHRKNIQKVARLDRWSNDISSGCHCPGAEEWDRSMKKCFHKNRHLFMLGSSVRCLTTEKLLLQQMGHQERDLTKVIPLRMGVFADRVDAGSSSSREVGECEPYWGLVS